ncbi:hypothetical protein [Rhizobium sp. S163]|uniref:hypothetical protein n=1 Tax=Rhizobium sp. S163 TaxID=3055039 RepID=UPI0025A9DB55|nr:hypothetical protein [Rhizobium sp. S163]MDM9646809.1 hypothetical protein [Rhizobium sp. S163]
MKSHKATYSNLPGKVSNQLLKLANAAGDYRADAGAAMATRRLGPGANFEIDPDRIAGLHSENFTF